MTCNLEEIETTETRPYVWIIMIVNHRKKKRKTEKSESEISNNKDEKNKGMQAIQYSNSQKTVKLQQSNAGLKSELVLSYGSQFSEFIFIFSGSEF
jgi:hypothetical protein